MDNRDKQIEEMARAMCFQRESCTVTSCTRVNCETTWLAENLYNRNYRKASEVAREIFAEIERMMIYGEIDGKYPIKVIFPDKFAELKKKYTESEKDNG